MKRLTSHFVLLLFLLFSSIPALAELFPRTHAHDVEELTLRCQSTIHLDSTLYREIDSTLSLARTVLDTFSGIHVFPSYLHYELLVGDEAGTFLETWGAGELETGIHFIDSLGSEYGLISVEGDYDLYPEWPGFVQLTFSTPAQMRRLGELYEQHPGVEWAEPNGLGGDGDDITLIQKPDANLYVFEHGWGDCPAGCIAHYWWYVSVEFEGPQLELATDYGSYYTNPQIFHWNVPARLIPAVYANVPSLIDSMLASPHWWVREHAVRVCKYLVNLEVVPPIAGYPDDYQYWGIHEQVLLEELRWSLPVMHNALTQTLGDSDSDVAALAEVVLDSLEAHPWYGATPREPHRFHLLTPEYGVELVSSDTTMTWEAAVPPDSADQFEYVFHLFTGSLDETSTLVFDSTQVRMKEDIVTPFSLSGDVRYYWYIEARRKDNPEISSTSYEYGSFIVSKTGTPQPFHVLSPVDGELIHTNANGFVTFLWTSAKNPDFPETPYYSIRMLIKEASKMGEPPLYRNTSRAIYDTSKNILISDYFGRQLDQDTLYIHWWVAARGGGTWMDTGSEEFYLTDVAPDGVGEEQRPAGPLAFEISDAYPNPFNPAATVVVGMPERARLRLEVFNLLGQRVAVLADGVVPQGWRSFVFDGSGLASGVYLVRATVPGKLEQTRRITLIR